LISFKKRKNIFRYYKW